MGTQGNYKRRVCPRAWGLCEYPPCSRMKDTRANHGRRPAASPKPLPRPSFVHPIFLSFQGNSFLEQLPLAQGLLTPRQTHVFSWPPNLCFPGLTQGLRGEGMVPPGTRTWPILETTRSAISCLSSSTCSPIRGIELSITCGDQNRRSLRGPLLPSELSF